MKSTGGERGIENGGVSRATCSERARGHLVVVVHRRGGWLAWGTREVQWCWCARSFGRRGREEGWRPRWAASVSVQSEAEGRGVGCTPGADRWGGVACWVRVPAW
jgi:hypothetical protein